VLAKEEDGSWLLECTYQASGRQGGATRNRDAEIQNGQDQDKEARWTGSGMLKEWKPPGKRLVMARFKFKYTTVTCYVPTEDAKGARE